MSHTVRHGTGALKSLALGKEYLHGKLVAVGIGELSHLQGGEDEACGRHNHYGNDHSKPGMAEGPLQAMFVGNLNPVCNILLVGFLCGCLSDDGSVENGNHHHGHGK